MYKKQGGISILESLVALILVSFGALTIAKYQLDLFATESVISAQEDVVKFSEKISATIKANKTNAECFITENAGSCTSADSLVALNTLITQASTSIKNFVSMKTTAVRNGTTVEYIKLELNWKTGKSMSPMSRTSIIYL